MSERLDKYDFFEARWFWVAMALAFIVVSALAGYRGHMEVLVITVPGCIWSGSEIGRLSGS